MAARGSRSRSAVAVAVVAVGASASRGDLASRYADHQRQASHLQSAIKDETTQIQKYLGSISAIQARLTRVQRTLDVQEGLLAQVRMELGSARNRVAELRVRYARDRRLLAQQVVANYETPLPNLVDAILTSNGRLRPRAAAAHQHRTAS